MRDVCIVGADTTKFGKHLDKGYKDLARMTVEGVLNDCHMNQGQIQSVWFSNSGWGMHEWQHCIRGQVALRPLGIDGVPITNVENACAGGSTALHGAYKDVASGLFDISLAVGVEKVYSKNKYLIFASFAGGMDARTLGTEVKRLEEFAPDPSEIPDNQLNAAKEVARKRKARGIRNRMEDYWNMFSVYVRLGETIGYKTINQVLKVVSPDHSPFMDVYGYAARRHMKKYGSTQRQMAAIASKNHWHSTMNPNAQYDFDVGIDEVLTDRLITYPLTRSMCAPIGDGAASAILASEEVVKKLGLSKRAVKIRASILVSGRTREWDDPDIAERAAKMAYEKSSLSPEDMDVVEVHDATAFGELHQTEALGFFPKGEGGLHAERGETRLGGKKPVNVSGGLISRGHPIGASGLAQVHELVTQLRGEAGKRQVANAKIAMAENGGGALGNEEAALGIHILSKD